MPKTYSALVFLLCFTLSNALFAQDKLKVAFSVLPPWKIVQNGVFKGAYAELAREMAKALNLEVKFLLCPLKRCLRMIETGAADIIIGVKDTSKRKKYTKFLSTPYRSSAAKIFYLRKNEHRQLAVYDDLYNFENVGVKSGAKYFKKFNEDPYLQKVSVSIASQNFAKLLHYRINVLIIAQDQGEFLTHALNIRDKVRKASFYFKDKSPRYIGVSKRSTHINELQRFEDAMSEISSSGKLYEIMLKNFFERYNIAPDQFNWQ